MSRFKLYQPVPEQFLQPCFVNRMFCDRMLVKIKVFIKWQSSLTSHLACLIFANT